MTRLLTMLALATAGAAVLVAAANAQDFYKGKTVTILSSSGEAGGYDAYARLLARHIGNQIPGQPTVIVVNMPGASGMVAANYMYNVTAPDGLTFAGVYRQMPFAPLFGTQGVKYDAQKFTWIGTASSFLDDVSLMFVNKKLGVASVADIKTLGRPLQFGSGGRTSTGDEGARIIGPVLGLDLRIIRGYQSSAQTLLAVERGEVDAMILGISSLSSAKPDWLKPDSAVNFILQFGFGGEGRHPQFPQVPRIDELAQSEGDKGLFFLLQAPFRIARPFAGPPAIPAERAAALQEAFLRTNRDPDYVREAEKLKLDISPLSGAAVAETIAQAYRLPPALVARYVETLAKGE